VADVHGILEVKCFDDFGNVGCVGVHVMAVHRLSRATVATPIGRNHAVALVQEEHHLGIPVVG
jgi:hypothetical protein